MDWVYIGLLVVAVLHYLWVRQRRGMEGRVLEIELVEELIGAVKHVGEEIVSDRSGLVACGVAVGFVVFMVAACCFVCVYFLFFPAAGYGQLWIRILGTLVMAAVALFVIPWARRANEYMVSEKGQEL